MSKNNINVCSYPRHESIRKVTGKPEYTDDLYFPNLVYGKILRSPYANAKVKSINIEKAQKIPGVLAIITAEDIPDKLFNCSGNPPSALLLKDERILTNRPLYVGDRIAAVAALNEELCQKALDNIEIEYEIFKPIFKIRDAILENAEIIQPHLSSTNIVKTMEVNTGDIDIGFKESDYIFEGDFFTPQIQVTAMEPTGCVCDYNNENKLTIWSTSQTPFQERRILSYLLEMQESDIRIVKPLMGGGFGARQQLHNQHVGAFLSKIIRRPVKIINSREEEMISTVARHEVQCKIKFGVMKTGKINAYHVKAYFNTGPYTTHGPTVVAAASKKVQYNISNYRFDGYCVLTNSPVSGAVRGYGNPQISFGREIMLDRISRKLGFDPIEFRMLNHIKTGEKFPGWTDPILSCEIDDCVSGALKIKKMIDSSETQTNGSDIVESWGIAFGCHTSGPSSKEGMSSSAIIANDDGSVNLLVGSADIGQGSETTLSQVVAMTLGIEIKDIRIQAADTLTTPYDTGTFGSSQMFVCGNAVKRSAEDLIVKIKNGLKNKFEVATKDIVFDNGIFFIKSPNGRIERDFKNAIKEITFGKKGNVIIASSSYSAEAAPPPFSVCFAKVEIDKRTNEIKVKHFIQAVDVGTPINPVIVEGQVEGGIQMGIGYALMEKIEIDNVVRKPISTDLLHYKGPLAVDMPNTYVYIANSYEPKGPHGAKSVGELSTVAVAPAIANAISNATGIEIDHLPLSKKFTISGTRMTQDEYCQEGSYAYKFTNEILKSRKY